ncbi:unnamed protein product [Enterobius vermicularis]|uniref:DUF3452 domain-containing protein n=1 Tax=Enterobius vermicularis TaxID=51028 RepID=A0A0N4V983_ENTVE|nr:unnamed protein product [Enterobius vermicularis]
MDIQALKQWLIIIDNLMTQDKTSFRELLMRISTTSNSTLSSLITSKESDHELRAQALKRLAFTVLSSELDRYQSQVPEIQERLSENIRLSQVPTVHAQVFLCYRVLLLRLRPSHLVSMWPAMVTELASFLTVELSNWHLTFFSNKFEIYSTTLVHVLLQIEQQLLGASSLSDDLKCDRSDHWMQLYLAACKLLEALCTLPSGYLPQYQMCHWAFVASVGASCSDSFVPFAGRISALLNNKFGQLTTSEKKLISASLLNVKTLTSFGELRPFFLALATQNKSLLISQPYSTEDGQLRDAAFMSGKLTYNSAISRLEHSLHVDFAEPWQL